MTSRRIAPGGKKRNWIAVLAGLILVCLLGAVELEIVRSYGESSRSTKDFVETVDSTTFLANVQREFYLYEKELLEAAPEDRSRGEAAQRRMFLNRQIDLLSGFRTSEAFKSSVGTVRLKLAHLNALVRSSGHVAGNPAEENEMRRRLRDLELVIKHAFDAEESVLYGTVGETMEKRESSQRTLAALAGVVFVLASLIALAFARSVRSRLSQAYTALLRTSEEKEKVALHLEESLARLEIAQIEREGFLDTLLESVEEERVRIAGELHDRPIQQLTMVNYDLALAKLYVEEGDTAAGLQELEVVEKNLSEQIDGLRKLMADLRPPALDQVGLIGALQDHVADFEQRCNIACSLDARLDVRPEPNVETVLYRVAQEALANVLKHAQADHVRLSLGQIDGEIVLKIQDDGVGFSSDRMSRGRDHFGMTSMEHRVELAGGSFLLTTGPDAGTTVEVHFGALVPQDLRTAA